MSNSLCWKCANCTSTEKCEFVNNINKYYRKNKNKFTKTGKVELIKDLKKYYIKGTKTDNNGNILFCPKFTTDNLDHRSKTQIRQEEKTLKRKEKLNKSTKLQSIGRRKYILNNITDKTPKLTQEEIQARQLKFLQNISLKKEQINIKQQELQQQKILKQQELQKEKDLEQQQKILKQQELQKEKNIKLQQKLLQTQILKTKLKEQQEIARKERYKSSVKYSKLLKRIDFFTTPATYEQALELIYTIPYNDLQQEQLIKLQETKEKQEINSKYVYYLAI